MYCRYRSRSHDHPRLKTAARWRLVLALALLLPLATAAPAFAQIGFVGQVKLFAGNYAPVGWHDCDGSLIPISQNTALFSLIGTTYGGDGQTTFALPDLRGRAVVGAGQGPGLSSYVVGQNIGTETVTLTTSQLPSHTHLLQATTTLGSTASPAGSIPSVSPDAVGAYASAPNTTLNPAALESTGGSQPHPNMKPFLAIRYIICMEGIYPSRN